MLTGTKQLFNLYVNKILYMTVFFSEVTMAKVYQCITGNWLCGSKRLFNSYNECKNHIKRIIDMKESWVTQEQIESSIRVIMIETEIVPEYRKIFKEFKEIFPMTKLSKEEMAKNRFKINFNQKSEEKKEITPPEPKKTIIRHVKKPAKGQV